VTTPAALIAIWGPIAALKLVSPVFLPTSARVWLALENGFAHTDLLAKALGTIGYMFGGWLAASIAGAALDALIGSCKATAKARFPLAAPDGSTRNRFGPATKTTPIVAQSQHQGVKLACRRFGVHLRALNARLAKNRRS
jgi:hypothetical protein